MDTCTQLPDCWIHSSEDPRLPENSPPKRPSSVESLGTKSTLLNERNIKTPEFGAYWRKAHRILKAVPQAKTNASTDPGKL